MEIRGPDGLRGLGHAVVPGALARAAHDEQVAVAGGHADRGAAAARAAARGRAAPDREDRDHRVLVARPPDAVAVPGHRVVAVAVEAQARGDERLAELGA